MSKCGCFSASNLACRTLINKTGNQVSIGLDNDHTVIGTVVGVFDHCILLLSKVTIKVGACSVACIPFYWVDCSHIAWYN